MASACSDAQSGHSHLLTAISAATLFAVMTTTMSFFLRHYYSGRRRGHRRGGFPPGPRGLPVVGNLFATSQFTHRGLAELAKVHGGFFHLRIGFADVLVVSSPDAAREILQEHAAAFSHRPVTAAMAYVSYDLADMAFARYGPFWRQMRKLCVVKLFSRAREQSWRTVRAEVDALVRSLSLAAAEEGAVAGVGELAFKFATKATLRAAFGARSREDEAEFVAIIRELSQAFMAFNVADFVPCLAFLDLNGVGRRTRAARRALDVFIDRIIDEHLAMWDAGGVSAADMVDDMIAYLAEETETPGAGGGGVGRRTTWRDTREDGVELKDLKLTRENVKGLIMDLMFGGTETVAATLEWAMVELLRNPGELERAQAELAAAVGFHRKVDDGGGDLDRLPYLRCVCREVLRLHPPLPLLLRECCLPDDDSAVVVGGHAVPSGTRVWINVWAMGRDERRWGQDAAAFRPSRFAGGGDGGGAGGGEDLWYLPFGYGRRSCPGMQLGMYAVELALANLLHCFRWSLPEGVAPGDLDVGDVFGLTAPRAQRLLAVPSPRLTCPLF